MEWLRGVCSHDEIRELYVEADYYDSEWNRLMLSYVNAWSMAEAHRCYVEVRTAHDQRHQRDSLLDYIRRIEEELDAPEHSLDTSVVEVDLNAHGAHAPPVALVATSNNNGGPPT